MTIVLLHPYHLTLDPAEQKIMKPYPPLGLMYLSAWLNRAGLDHHVIDGTFSSPEEVISRLTNLKPTILAIYATLMTRHNVLNILSYYRGMPGHQPTIIIGGPDSRHHATGYLDQGAAYIIPGEGEIPLTRLINTLVSGKNPKTDEVPGIISIDPLGNLLKTAEPPRIDPDDLPFPNREAFDMKRYLQSWEARHGYTSMTISTMRGCPFSCKWCSKSVYGNRYRRRSPALVVEELGLIRETYNPGQVWFTDDVFTISREWLVDFASALKTASIHIPYECISRTDRLDEDVLDLLKETGCRKLWIGAESGSQRVIDLMDRRININDTIGIMRQAARCGLQTGTFIMTGYPGETMRDITATARFIKAAKPTELTLGQAYPIKGTPLFEESEKNFVKPYHWDHITEREIMLKRRYSSKFYRLAHRYLRISFMSGRETRLTTRITYNVKAWILNGLMHLIR